MVTVFEDLCVELIQEILLYFQYHEIQKMFSNLNSRFTTIVTNMSFMPIYLGFNGMNISTSEFYYKHLSQENVFKSLISLCVSDEFAFDNGLWLASRLSTYVNLCHLCLIDIKRFTFESILNSLSPMYSMNTFSVRFSMCSPIHDTFEDVPEGAYCDRIFHLFPLLRVCQLDFVRSVCDTIDRKFVLPSDQPFMPIDISLRNLRSLAISGSRNFLSHLLEHLPQLEQLKYRRTNLWLSQEHPLANNHNLQASLIGKRLAPNLRHLFIYWDGLVTLKSLTEFFERDLLISLTKFEIHAAIDNPDFLHHLLLILSSQCLYSFDVTWLVKSTVPLAASNQILLDTCELFKQWNSTKFEIQVINVDHISHTTRIRAVTKPKLNKFLFIDSYFNQKMIIGQNQCSSTVELVQWNEIRINGHFNEVDEQVFYSSLSIIPWHQITSIDIPQLFNRTFLHRLISQLTNLRKLKLEYLDRTYSHSYCKDETLLNILNDCSLCAMLMANGLRQLVLSVEKAAFTSTSIEIANLIVQRLCHLEIVTLDGFSDQLLQMTPILLNGLRKLSFFTFIGNIEENQINEKKLHDLQHSITRSFRTAVRNTFRENNQVLIWL